MGYGSYIVFIYAKKLHFWFILRNFFPSEVALYFYITAIRSYVEYCFHAWAGDSNCCMDLLYK